MMLQKLDAYTKLIANLADKPNLSASDMKAYFDSSPEEIRVAFNNLIDALKAITDGDSGADNIGATAITGLTGTTVQTLLEALKTQIDNVTLGQIPDNSITSAKLSTDAKKAVNITVDDTAGHFTATEVEDVLAELFQFANDGKTNIATVVGSPTTTSDTFSQLQTHIQDAKNSMATNLTNKGQSSTGTEALQALADKIANVSTGKKYASGTATVSSSNTLNFTIGTGSAHSRSYIEITGLDFTPSIIICRLLGTSGGWVTTFNTNNSFATGYPNIKIVEMQTTYGQLTTATSTGYILDGTNAYVSNQAFRLPMVSGTIEWIAYE